MITRSGIEVAVHAEPERPVVRIGRRYELRGSAILRGRQERTGTDRQTVERGRTVQLGIHHVQTHVEVLGDVPLGARTDPPSAPVAITAVGHKATGAETAPEALGSAAVADLRITAIQRCTPARAPEVLVGRVDVPRRGQLKRGCSNNARAVYEATVYSVSDGTKARTVAAVVEGPARLRGLEDVPQRALGVVHLRLEVVAARRRTEAFSLIPPPITQPSLSSGWPLRQ